MDDTFSKTAILDATEPLVSQSRAVRFQDVDAAGTIYFVRVFEYFGDAYLELLERGGLDVPAMLRERTRAAPLANARADYLAPLFFGDRVEVQIVLARLGRTSVSFGHRIAKPDGTIAAVGQTTHVFIDPKRFSPIALPDSLRSFLAGKPGVSS